MLGQITLAIIGRGHWGQVYQKNIRALALKKPSDGMPCISLSDENIYGRNYKNELEKSDAHNIDGVIIAASTCAHYEVATYLLEHGFYRLLIEKPLTETYAQAKKLQEMLKTIPEALVLVGHTLIYDPAYNALKEAAQSTIGRILQIDYTSLKAPHIEGKTIIPDAGSPPIYLFLNIAGRTPITVTAKHTINDNVELTLEFDNGIRGVAHIGTIYPERKREIALTGEKGKLILNEFMDPRELLFIDNKGTKENLYFPTDHTSLQLEILKFIACITQNKKPLTPISAGIDVVKIIEAAEYSFQNGGTPTNII